MTSINYNEFQAGQGVSAPALNQNFSLTNTAIETLESSVNSSITTLTSSVGLKANKNGSSAEKFNVAAATEDTQAVNLSQLNTRLAPLSPTGSVIWFAGSTVPTGYLLCDGSLISRVTYADLFSVIGVIYGVGDGSTTFALPQLTDNRFIEGSSTVATKNNAALTVKFARNTIPITSTLVMGSNYTGYIAGVHEGAESHAINDVLSGNVTFNNPTVRPKSLTLLPCIKY